MSFVRFFFVFSCRGKSGRLRSLPALYQDDDDGNDLSDLGLSVGKKGGGGSGGSGSGADDDRHRERAGDEDVFRPEDDAPAATENGYDRAIKDYVDFAESKKTEAAVKRDKEQQQPPPRRKPPAAEAKRRTSAPKIEEKVMLLKTRSQSTRELNTVGHGVQEQLPRVDIGKRRELFERMTETIKAGTESVKKKQLSSARQAPGVQQPQSSSPADDLPPGKSAAIDA